MLTADSHILAAGTTTVAVDEVFEFARWSSGNALLVGGLLTGAALYAVVWMYRREARGRIGPRLRWSMVVARVCALLLLGLIGLEPVLVKNIHRRLDAVTLVLVDESASMSLADRYRREADARRAEAAIGPIPPDGAIRTSLCERLLWGKKSQWLRSLTEKNDVKLFSFGDTLIEQGLIPRQPSPPVPTEDGDTRATSQPRSTPDGDPSIRFTPEGAATDIGMAVRGAIDSVAGAPIAGLVILTDGGFNRGEAPSVVGRFLKHRQIPLVAIGVGDPAEPVNVRVTRVAAPRSAFKNDPFRITVRIEAEGVGDEGFKLELLERRVGETDRATPVETRTIHPDADGRFAPVVFERKVAEPGMLSYLARVVPLPFESVTTDNQREVLPAVRILDDKMKVLLIAGSPSYDYRFLARLLERDETVDLATWLQSADILAVRDGNTVITELPNTIEALNHYDAIILLDCDPREFDPTWGSLAATFVSDHGGGLLVAAGNKYTGSFFRSPNMLSLVEVLPIVPDPEAEIVINDLGHYQTRSWPILIPEDAGDDPILRLSDNPAETRAIWSLLGQVYWHYPVRREKPVARALMRHSNPRRINAFGPHVLFATQFVGTGRTAFLGINATWRWRRFDETYFNRFWIQTLRYLVEGKLLGGRARGQILTPKEQYDLGESVVLTVRALDEHFNPLLMPELDLLVRRGDTPPAADGSVRASDEAASQTVALSPIPGRYGYYEGRFVPGTVGLFKLRLDLPSAAAGGAGADSIEHEIVVTKPDVEMRNTAMNRPGLKEFVETASVTGRYLEIDEARQAAELIEDCSRTFVVRGRPRPLWNNTVVFSILIALLTLEWILRKKAKLL
ncbi:MAG: hypothetical protein ACE5EC_00580 [Phycisphaerae bacterium]